MNSIGAEEQQTGEAERILRVPARAERRQDQEVARDDLAHDADYWCTRKSWKSKMAQGRSLERRAASGAQGDGNIAGGGSARYDGYAAEFAASAYRYYSSEDLAQLIRLRTVNPRARIGVKMVSGSGVGIIRRGAWHRGRGRHYHQRHKRRDGSSP